MGDKQDERQHRKKGFGLSGRDALVDSMFKNAFNTCVQDTKRLDFRKTQGSTLDCRLPKETLGLLSGATEKGPSTCIIHRRCHSHHFLEWEGCCYTFPCQPRLSVQG